MKAQRTLASLLLTTLVLSASPRLAAQPPPAAVERARGHFQRGVDLYTERNYAAALVEFRRAHEAAPNYRLLFNVAQTCHELSDYVCAVQAYQDYLAQGGAEVEVKRVAEVEESIKKLRARVASLLVTSSVEGAEIQIDDQPAGTAPLAKPVLVSAGRRKVTASRPGFVPVVKVVDVASGDAISVALVFEAPGPRAAAPPPEAPRSGGVSGGVWAGVGIASALAVGAAVTGILTARSHGDYQRQLDTFPGSRAAIDDAAAKTKRLSITTDVLAGGAVAAGALTLILGLTARREAAPPPVSAALGPGAFVVRGCF
jgi:hypothetical protein